MRTSSTASPTTSNRGISGNTRGAVARTRRHTRQMVTVTRKIRRTRLVPTIRTVTSLLHLRRCPNQPEEGWFTLQSEPSEGRDRDPAVPAKPRSERTGRDQQHARALPTVRSRPTVGHERVRRVLSVLVARHRRLLVAIAVTSALAAGATAAALGSHNSRHSALMVAQRTKIAQLAAQRDQALAAARQAHRSQVAWRAQAIRWRSRALATRRRPRKRSARGRQRQRSGRRRT
jgi:hypothetical protein